MRVLSRTVLKNTLKMILWSPVGFIVVGCFNETTWFADNNNDAASALSDNNKPQHWKMVTAWPKDFPVVGTGANYFAETLTELSGGRIKVTVYGAGELGSGLEVLDLVTSGVAELGHSASFYWRGKVNALQVFGAMPYGMTANEMNAWLYHGTGLKLWQELYATMNIVPFPAGQTGVQMGGWFNKEINTLTDIEGLRMRIPGLGGEVFAKMGGIPVVLPAGEIFSSLTTGTLDAAEWSGPANDLPQGFHKAAEYYYYPGWQEPTTTVELIINREIFSALPADLKSIITYTAQAANMSMMAEYTYKNITGLTHILTERSDIKIRPFPNDVIEHSHEMSQQVIAALNANDAAFSKIYLDYNQFLINVATWSEFSERAYLEARSEVIQ
ncbi:monocarboxylate 2-oxoacid-binding periplasmic protein [Spirochaetota bacterium]|nr:monocarboxylate 2-oxoacid-binding periplasmic protein [Spirochaetota bacterium]